VRIEALVSEMMVDDGVRLAGARRLALERKAREEGVEIPDELSLRA
jgi:(2R)-3-sulfolactate dehydrogenase (NADP+)